MVGRTLISLLADKQKLNQKSFKSIIISYHSSVFPSSMMPMLPHKSKPPEWRFRRFAKILAKYRVMLRCADLFAIKIVWGKSVFIRIVYMQKRGLVTRAAFWFCEDFYDVSSPCWQSCKSIFHDLQPELMIRCLFFKVSCFRYFKFFLISHSCWSSAAAARWPLTMTVWQEVRFPEPLTGHLMRMSAVDQAIPLSRHIMMPLPRVRLHRSALFCWKSMIILMPMAYCYTNIVLFFLNLQIF